MSKLENLLLTHTKLYPQATIQDIVKLLYQKNMGCGHLVTESGQGLNWIIDECKNTKQKNIKIEDIGEDFARIYLCNTQNIDLIKQIYELFVLSSKESCKGLNGLISDINELKSKYLPLLPYEKDIVINYLKEYEENNYPMVRHSQQYNIAYAPAYRVVSKKLL